MIHSAVNQRVSLAFCHYKLMLSFGTRVNAFMRKGLRRAFFLAAAPVFILAANQFQLYIPNRWTTLGFGHEYFKAYNKINYQRPVQWTLPYVQNIWVMMPELCFQPQNI